MSKTQILPRDAERAAFRGGKWLRTLSTRPDVMAVMVALGYSEKEHQHGWDLYLRMLGYKGATKPTPILPATVEQRDALSSVDGYDERAFVRARAALERLHPQQALYIFGDGLKAATGPEAVGTVQTFLNRYAALRDGTDPARGETRDADKAAAMTLEERNIVNPTIEKQLRAQIEIVRKLAPAPTAQVMSASEEALNIATGEFTTWLKDWRATAQAGVNRRDYRIMLGVAQRRTAKTGEGDTPEGPTDDTDE